MDDRTLSGIAEGIGEALCGRTHHATKFKSINDDTVGNDECIKQSSSSSTPSSSKKLFVVTFLINAFILLDLFMFKWSESRLNLNATSLVAKKDSTATATSGKVYRIAKIRTYDETLLQFQSSSNSMLHASLKPSWPEGAFWNRPDCTNWGAATTIFAPTIAVEQFVALDGWCLVVAGDRKGPTSYQVEQNGDKIVFLSRERQEELAEHFEFVRKTPWNHFARKNVAYLYAIANGAHFIWDFDDDNILYPNETLSSYTASSSSELRTVLAVDTRNNTECSVFNPYPFFRSSEQGVWPRGYPLDKINPSECELSSQYCTRQISSQRIGIYQSLADKDPDVDAVYRLTRRLPITFAGAPQALPVLVPLHTMSPMNAQASLFSRIGMWSMFLPTTVHGRVSDIWRSYLAQAVGKYCQMVVTFVGPHVVQDRNAHSYLADLDAEKQLYERSGSLISYLLTEWRYDHDDDALAATMEGAMERLFVDMYERGIVERQDVELVQMWIASLRSVGYKFPFIKPTTEDQERTDEGMAKAVNCSDWNAATPTSEVAEHDSNVADQATGDADDDKETCSMDKIVLVGQFNFDTKARPVLHWVKRWRNVVRQVEVRGPFNLAVVKTLRGAGVNVYEASADAGFYSPMKNLADSLQQHAKNADICGVAILHDDLLLNMTYLKANGFPSAKTVFTEFPARYMSTPYMTVYPNATFKLPQYQKLFSAENYDDIPVKWPWWRKVIPNITRAIAVAPGRQRYVRADGGMDLYQYAQSDFLYVPTSMAKQFALHAEWMVKNEIFLEIATPIIVAKLIAESNAGIHQVPLCSEWNDEIRGNPGKWVPQCYKAGTGAVHPVKLTRLGPGQWNTFFDKIVLGTS